MYGKGHFMKSGVSYNSEGYDKCSGLFSGSKDQKEPETDWKHIIYCFHQTTSASKKPQTHKHLRKHLQS